MTQKKKSRAWVADLVLLAAVAASLGLFTDRLLHPPQPGDRFEALGTFKSGQASRKPMGAAAFVQISPGDTLRNLDTLWVDLGHVATIEWKGGEKIDFAENSLVLLKRPFSSSIALPEQVVVLRGSGKVSSSQTLLGPGQAALGSLPEFPPPAKLKDDAKLADSSAEASKSNHIEPPPGALMYSTQPEVTEVSFAWFKPLTGYLSVRDETTQRVEFFNLENASFAKIPRKQNRAYAWQIVDPQRKPVLGPFKFELKVGDPNDLANLIRQNLGPGAGSGKAVEIKLEH